MNKKSAHRFSYSIIGCRYAVFTALILVITGFSDAVSSGADEFPWPIQSPKHISATFGEPRPGRFHMGVDFKSGGVTGKKVVALGDGFISHIRTSPFGYGKALYLTLDSGKTAVYGHLSGYLPEVEDRLFRMRIDKKSYDIDWYPQPDEFRVKNGQVIAYSGDTGSGPAHLHIEIRDKNNVPQNLLNHGVVVHDTVPPKIDSALLVPLDIASSVDGIPSNRWCDFTSAVEEPFVLSGRIGVAVSTHDAVNMSGNHLGVYHISLAVDSTIVFSKSYDRISYNDSRYGAFDYVAHRHNGGRGYLSALFRQTGNELDFYEGNGVLSAELFEPDTEHIISIRARDYAGNETERSFPVIFGSRPVITACEFTDMKTIRITGLHPAGALERAEITRRGTGGERQPDYTIALEGGACDVTVSVSPDERSVYEVVLIDENGFRSLPAVVGIDPQPDEDSREPSLRVVTALHHDRIVVRVTSTDILGSIPAVQVEEDGQVPVGFLCLVPAGENAWVTSLGFPRSGKSRIGITASALSRSLAVLRDSTTVDLTACQVTAETTIISPDSLFTVAVGPGSLYRSAPVTLDTASVKTANGLRLLSQGYRIFWGDYPLKGACDIELELDRDPPETAALYSSGNGNGWNFITADHEGRVFRGKLGGSGYVAVLTDTYKPYVAAAVPRPGTTVKSKRPLIRARVQDKGAGIEGSDSIRMSIDGITIYGEYDYEADWVSYRPHNPLKPGNHTVKITVTDRVGNSRELSWNFNIAE